MLRAAAFGLAASPLLGCDDKHGPARAGPDVGGVRPLDGDLPQKGTRTFLGPGLWANRLHDWRLADGRIECLRPGSARTVALVGHTLHAGSGDATLAVHTGVLGAGDGFSGFLIGVGRGALDPLAAALAQGVSGTGGGILCVYETDGRVRFRDHTGEQDQRSFAVLVTGDLNGDSGEAAHRDGGDVRLTLSVLDAGRDRVLLRLVAADAATSAVLSSAEHTVAAAEVAGGVLLASGARHSTARHWFRDIRLAGERISRTGETVGPIVGTLFAVNAAPVTAATLHGSTGGPGGASAGPAVLKLTAVLQPVGREDPQRVDLQVRDAPTAAWRTVGSSRIGESHAATFRVQPWHATRSWDYRVLYAAGTDQEQAWTGTIPKDPGDTGQACVGMVNCTIHTGRAFDAPSSGLPRLPGGRDVGLYTPENLYFPYTALVRNLTRHAPDILVASGDQYYESHPTALPRDADDATLVLDVLYRFYLWMLSFRELTRSTPCLVQVDDHDVLQGNLYGWSGARAPGGDDGAGGYVRPAAVVNAVQAVQCAHNPDPWDPRPVLQGITVYYAHLRWAGLSFALLEDRKFKNNNRSGRQADGEPFDAPRQLLGPRQEDFLRAWAGLDPGLPHIALAQTLWGGATTTPQGAPFADSDNNGAVPEGRRRAVALVKAAGGIVLSGDTHFASLVRQGIDTFTDGPLQFTGPAAGSLWQRWFTPARPLANAGATPHTGDWTDAWGSRMRVLAVANPKVGYAEFRRAYPQGNDLADRSLKHEGYGIVRVDGEHARYVLECWDWRADPEAGAQGQFPGWPYELPFSQV